MAKKRRKAAKSAKKPASKTSARVAKQRTAQGFTGLVKTAIGIRPKFTEIRGGVHDQITALFVGKRTPFLKICGTSMAGKYLIVKLSSREK